MPQLPSFIPQLYRPNSTLAEMIMRRGEQQAQGQRELWGGIGQSIAGLGQAAGQAIEQGQAQRQLKAQQAEMSKRDAAWVSYVESGEWSKDPQAAYATTMKIWGPEKAEAHFKGLQGAAQLGQPKRDPTADTKALGYVIGAIDATKDEAARARLFPQAAALAKSAFPEIQVDDHYDPAKWEEISSLGKQIRGEKPPEPPKALSLDAQLAAAAPGTPEYAAVLQKKRDEAAATRAPKESQPDEALGLTPAAVDSAARRYLKDGTLPPAGMGKQGAAVRRQILNRAAEVDPEADIAANKAGYRADSASMNALQKQTDAVSAFETTASKNAGLLKEIIKTVPDLGTKFLNRPIRALAGQLGSADVAKLDAIRQSVANEYAKIISNPNLSGTMSDSARKEGDALLSSGATVAQMLGALETLASEAHNRKTSYQGQLASIKGRLGDFGDVSSGGMSSAIPGAATVAPTAASGGLDAFLAKFGDR